MSEASEMLDAGIRMQENVTGNKTFIYRGQHWPCIAGGLKRGIGFEIGPPVNQLARTLTVRKSAVPVRTADMNEGWTADMDRPTGDEDIMPPHPGKVVIFEARRYEIEDVEEDGAGAAWIVRLKSPD